MDNLYKTKEEFIKDLEQVWANAFLFNSTSDPVYKYTKEIEKFSQKLIK